MAERYKATENEKVACTECSKEVKRKSLNTHMKYHKNKESINCIIQGCSETIYAVKKSTRWHRHHLPRQFYNHLEIVHNVNLKIQKVCVEFKCKQCSEFVHVESAKKQVKNFWRKTAVNWSKILSRHITENHSIGDQDIDIKSDWEMHYNRASIFLVDQGKDKSELQKILETLRCKLCEFVVSKSKNDKRNLVRHYCQEHFKGPMTKLAQRDIKDNFCSKCNKKYCFSSKTKELVHVGYNHLALYPYLKVDSDVDLKLFIQKEVGVKKVNKYPCIECGKVFSQKGNLKIHLIYHGDERPFSCKTCEKAFKTLRDLDVHKRSHSDLKLFSCNICGKTFSQSANLWTHTNVYHTEGAHTCKDCRKEFLTKWNLKLHQTDGCILKPFPCDRCGKGFQYKTYLKAHSRVHEAQ